MEHVNFDGVNAIMMRGEKGPEHGIFWEDEAESECYSQCIMRLEGNESCREPISEGEAKGQN